MVCSGVGLEDCSRVGSLYRPCSFIYQTVPRGFKKKI
jgi:hypothetical protein